MKARLADMHEEPIDGIKDAIARLEADIKAWDDTASRIAEIERIEQRVAQQKAEDEKRLATLRSEIQALNQTIGDREEGIKIFKTEFPVYVISRVIRDIEKSMNDFLKRTYPKYTIQIGVSIQFLPNGKNHSTTNPCNNQLVVECFRA